MGGPVTRHRGVPVKNMERGDIAYDVHVRRVFLRTRLADRDDRNHMIAVARQLHPARPGALDLPAWRVGRTDQAAPKAGLGRSPSLRPAGAAARLAGPAASETTPTGRGSRSPAELL